MKVADISKRLAFLIIAVVVSALLTIDLSGGDYSVAVLGLVRHTRHVYCWLAPSPRAREC
jgi:hypothetical protein